MGMNTFAYIRSDLAAELAKSPMALNAALRYPPHGTTTESYHRWLSLVHRTADQNNEARINPEAIVVHPPFHNSRETYVESSDAGIREYEFDYAGPRIKNAHLPDGTRLTRIIPSSQDCILPGRSFILRLCNDHLSKIEKSPMTLAKIISEPFNFNGNFARGYSRAFDIAKSFNEPYSLEAIQICLTEGHQYFILGGIGIHETKLYVIGKKRGNIQPLEIELYTSEPDKTKYIASQWLKTQNLQEVSEKLNIKISVLKTFIRSATTGKWQEEKSILDLFKKIVENDSSV